MQYRYRTLQLIKESGYRNITKDKRTGICDSLLKGIEYEFTGGKTDIVINLDADAIIRNDYLPRMLELHKAFPNDIITGFHSTTKNKDGSERHPVIQQNGFLDTSFLCNPHTRQAVRKRSVGGINMLWTRETWRLYKPEIEYAMKERLNWDHIVSIKTTGIICAVPSLVQHIGIESAMGHTEQPDVADDFKILRLPDVTLVCVDDNVMRSQEAVKRSCEFIDFGKIAWITNLDLRSKEAYSRFILKELHKYIPLPTRSLFSMTVM